MTSFLRKLIPATCVGAAALFCTVAASRADVFLDLDFTNTGGIYTAGFTPVYGNFLADTPNATTGILGSDGKIYDFSFTHVGVYSTGNTSQPLTTAGFYTFGNATNTHTFTLTGLTAGSTVTLYAVSAWDGNGRGGTITFGASATKAQYVGAQTTTPTLANFTQINAIPYVVDATGIVTGTLLGSDGTPLTEGQVGAFVFDISSGNNTAVPEPMTWAATLLVSAGMIGLVVRRRAARSSLRC